MRLRENANARVIMVAKKTFRLKMRNGEEVTASARGKLFENDDQALAPGDEVWAECHHEQWMIEKVLPRKNQYVRQGLRKERQVLFANVDRVLMIASLSQPETKTSSIDRFLVAALFAEIPVWLILTKKDLDESKSREFEIREIYSVFDLPIYSVSNQTHEGIEELRKNLGQGITAVVGNSGVGKSSLLNSLIPDLDLKVQEISSWSGKGIHTTTAATLIEFSNEAALMDTAGMKSFVPYGVSTENLQELFHDIAEFAAECKFTDCRHHTEPGCAVRDAVENGNLSPLRLKSFNRLREDLK